MVIGNPVNTGSNGVTNFEFRPRYEVVQQQGKQDAQAVTARVLAGYTTPQAGGFGATLELIGVAAADTATYGVPVEPLPRVSNPAYASILDPVASNFNQAYVSYDGFAHTRILAGRQMIELDDQRFVGNVGFRQNMQTYDGLSVVNHPQSDFRVMAAYLFGEKNVLNQEVNMNTFLAEADWTRYAVAHIDVFGYWYGNQENAGGSTVSGNDAILPGAALCGAGPGSANSLVDPQACNSATLGMRLHGDIPLADAWQASYVAEYARQNSWDGGYSAIGNDFDHFDGTLHWGTMYASADYMLMGANANGTYGFQTPMATKHAFNGWAEMFLTTPKEGLRSNYATVGDQNVYGFDVLVRYYRFATDYQGTDLGHEWDWSIGHPLARNVDFVVQLADFTVNASGAASYADLQPGKPAGLENTTAMWAMLTAKF